MSKKFENKLLTQQAELYCFIKEKSINELGLPIAARKSMVGFGRILGFYMFWISAPNDIIVFNSRKEFSRCGGEIIRIEFVPENKDAILNAIQEIYNSYLDFSSSGKLQEEIQKIKERKALRSEVSNKRKELSTAQFIWRNVGALANERLTQYSFTDFDFDESTTDLILYGERVEKIFDKFLDIISKASNESLSRKISIYREYIEDDKTTLAAVGNKYGVTRECIRQYVNKVNNKIFRCFQKVIRAEKVEICECVQELADIFEAVNYDAVLLSEYGMPKISRMKKSAIFKMLFGNDFYNNLVEKCESYAEKRRLLQKEKALYEEWEFFNSKIYFPSSTKTEIVAQVSSWDNRFESAVENKFYSKIKRFEAFIEIVKNPDIVYCSTSTTDHRPNFLLRLQDRTNVLVVVVPTINMSYAYNIKRFNELHRFCSEHGYGYLIIDDRGNSIYDLKNKVIDPMLVVCFDGILNKEKVITWQDIRAIKQVRPVSNSDIAAYVLQNKLYAIKEPVFFIKRRNRS